MRMNPLAAAVAALALTSAAGTTSLSAQTKADEVLAAARKAIGNGKLESLKTLSLEARIARTTGTFQLNTDVELQLEMPDKYWRSDSSSSPMSFQSTSGFNGDRSLSSAAGGTTTMNGATVVRMGPGGVTSDGGPAPKPTPEQQAERNRLTVRNSRMEISRLLLGWFAMAHPSLAVSYSYAGEAQAPDGKADVIDVKDASGFSARVFIDQRTHLPLVVTYQGVAPRLMTTGGPGGGAGVQTFTRQVGGDGAAMSEEERRKLSAEAESRMKELQTQTPAAVEIKLYVSDWSAVDGVRFPHKIQRATGDTPSEEWAISKVRINQKIDAKKFQVKSTN